MSYIKQILPTMEIIIPCAGLSTRFPNLRPKYLLVDYSGKMMLENVVRDFVGCNITVTILKEHDVQFDARKKIVNVLGSNTRVVILDKPTDGPADTVYQTIKQVINPREPILVKGCDGFYKTHLIKGNVIHVSKLSKQPNLNNAPDKSYVISNEHGIVSSIVEKQNVSDSFCIGSYQFETAEKYLQAFEKVHTAKTSEISISNVIDYMISNGESFLQSEVSDFIDVGTADDWFEYNNKPTYFCDIDGTIIKSNDHNAEHEALEKNVQKLKAELARGCKIVFCTARHKKYRTQTRIMLRELGFEECELVMEVNHSRRILINDYANSNPYPSAVAVNLKRDEDTLGDVL